MTATSVHPSWSYVHGHRRKPHLHPVATPAGDVLTRAQPPDHPWHHGLWFTIKYVNGENFWEEVAPYGVLRHREPPTVADGAIAGAIDWIRPDRTTVVVHEGCVLRHVDLEAGAYAIDVEVALRPVVDVVLDRTPFTTWGGYGGLTLRGRPDWEHTRLLLDDGRAHDRVLGQPSRWLDVSGTFADTGRAGGLAILDAPTNPRSPTPWYASTRAATYGDEGWSNFVNAAFLWHEAMAVAAGDELDFRYRVVVHDGEWGHRQLQDAYEEWIGDA